MRSFHCLAAVALLVPTPLAQGTTIVTGGGDALVRALATANHGDTFIVRAAARSYTSALATKGVNILCDVGVRFEGSSGRPLGVHNLPAGRTFVLRGGHVQTTTNAPDDFAVENCGGNVIVENLVVTGTLGARIHDSSFVTLNHCTLRGLSIRRSVATITSCEMTGFPASSHGFGAALRVEDSSVAVAHGRYFGSDSNLVTAPASTAIHLQSGSLALTGDSVTAVIGGSVPRGAGAPAIDTRGGRIQIDPRVTLTTTGAPPIAGPARVTTHYAPSIQADGVGSEQLLTIRQHARPGSFTALWASRVAPVTTTMFGDVWIDRQAVLLYSGVVPISGAHKVCRLIPRLPRGSLVVLQSASGTATGGAIFGPPTICILD